MNGWTELLMFVLYILRNSYYLIWILWIIFLVLLIILPEASAIFTVFFLWNHKHIFQMLTNLVNVKNDMNIYFIDSLFVLYGKYVKALPSVNRTPVASSYTNVKSLSIILLFCQNQWNIRDMYLCCGLYCASYYNLFPPCTQDNNPSWLIICIPFSLSYCNTLWSVEM